MLHLVNRLTLFSLIGLLVVAPSREDFGYASDPFRQTTQERRGAGSGAGGENDVRALEPGKPHRRVLADGQRHTYRIRLAADQFLKAVIEQDGIDVVARLLGPDGEQIMEFDTEKRLRGWERFRKGAKRRGTTGWLCSPGRRRRRQAPMRFGSKSCGPRQRMTALCKRRASCIRKPSTCATQADMTKRCRILNGRWRFARGG